MKLIAKDYYHEFIRKIIREEIDKFIKKIHIMKNKQTALQKRITHYIKKDNTAGHTD